MFIVTELNSVTSAFNSRYVQRLAVNADNNKISDYVGSKTMLEEENASARFEDIVAALASGLPIYDTRKKVGYWKKRKSTSTPEAPAQEAPAKK